MDCACYAAHFADAILISPGADLHMQSSLRLFFKKPFKDEALSLLNYRISNTFYFNTIISITAPEQCIISPGSLSTTKKTHKKTCS